MHTLTYVCIPHRYSKIGETLNVHIHVLEIGVIIKIRSKSLTAVQFDVWFSVLCFSFAHWYLISVFISLQAALLSHQNVTVEESGLCSRHQTLFETINSQLSNYWFFRLYSVALVVNKKLFIPRRTIAHFLFPHFFLQRNLLSFSVQHTKNLSDPMIRHNNNDGVKIPSFTGLFSAAWSMTLVCTCPGFYHFLMDGPQIQILPCSHPQLPLFCPSAGPLFNPSISFSFVHLFCAPLQFLLPSRLFLCLSLCSLCPSLPVTLWIFASLLRNGTQGTGALQSILQTARPRRTRSKCHVTTWEDDIWRRRGETAPKYLLLPAVLRLKGGGYD